MTAVALLDRLERVRQTGPGRWVARCPSHEDRSPSLSIREVDGRVLLHDFGGCETGDVLAALGLSMSDLFERPLGTFARSSSEVVPARDVLEILDHEITVASLILADVLDSRTVDNNQWSRLAQCAGRIEERAPMPAVDYDAKVARLEDGPRVHAVRVSDVATRELEPIWPGILWIGKPTLFVGDPGLSKSTMVCDVVARVTRCREWPCGTPATLDGEVVMLSAEDDVSDTLKPRLEAAGADVSRVHFLDSIITGATDKSRIRHSWPSLVEHVDALGEWLTQHPGVRLLVVDPLAAYLTGADSHKQADVRAVLGALSRMAMQSRVGVLAVMHLNKGSGGNPLSIASQEVSRSLLLLARHT